MRFYKVYYHRLSILTLSPLSPPPAPPSPFLSRNKFSRFTSVRCSTPGYLRTHCSRNTSKLATPIIMTPASTSRLGNLVPVSASVAEDGGSGSGGGSNGSVSSSTNTAIDDNGILFPPYFLLLFFNFVSTDC